MIRHGLLLLLLIGGAAAQTQYGTAPKTPVPPPAQKGCPWLTQGSAARALGGAVSVTVNVSGAGEGVCNFSRQESLSESLEVAVSKPALPGCPPQSAILKGIGNEALSCRPHSASGESVEMISSRVRDLHFTVRLTLRGQKKPSKPEDPQNDTLEQIAEQVAGNLY